MIGRFRLEKANPAAAVSDPVKPITYYLGPGMPERWKPYVTAGVLQWLPAFEAAGFSNAIRVLDAPTPEQDPELVARGRDDQRHPLGAPGERQRHGPARHRPALG